MDWLKTVLGVVKTAAPIAANIVLPGSGAIIGGLMDSVLSETGGYSDGDLGNMTETKKAQIIAQNPELLAKLEETAIALEESIAKEQTANMQQVAETMQSELRHGNWWQKGWRPWNGYMFPIAVIGTYIGVPLWNGFCPDVYLAVEIPEILWVVWAGILGVAVYGRNKEKTAGIKNPSGAISKIIDKLTK